jgi:tetraacyldisaccharide 4'-kinase
MNIFLLLFRILKPVLIPLSVLYGGVVWLRNKMYNAGFFSSIQFSVPVISVGNLSTGGTGKTPHIEYLIRLLQYEYKVATMSRGYKRKTQGFQLAGNDSHASQIGDEPMQFHIKFPEVVVSVCEDRMTGIPRLLGERPDVDVILLDDAFQHRSVKPGLNILITDYSKPFYKDFILPFGSLRENRNAYKRANVIIVSKCPSTLTGTEKAAIRQSINPLPEQHLFFSELVYEPLRDFYTGLPYDLPAKAQIIMVAGIAKPEPMLQHLREQASNVHLLRYPDHHFFTINNLEEIRQTWKNWEQGSSIIVTTEKDATRLALHAKTLADWNIPLAVLPVRVSIMGEDAAFNQLMTNYIAAERAEMEW